MVTPTWSVLFDSKYADLQVTDVLAAGRCLLMPCKCFSTYILVRFMCVHHSWASASSGCRRHRHSGILYLSPVPEHSGTGLGPYFSTGLVPASAFLFIPVPDWRDAGQSDVPAFKGIFQPFELGAETSLIRSAVKFCKAGHFQKKILMIQSHERSLKPISAA